MPYYVSTHINIYAFIFVKSKILFFLIKCKQLRTPSNYHDGPRDTHGMGISAILVGQCKTGPHASISGNRMSKTGTDDGALLSG